jgi:acyl-CoA synthetase (AMP-forming)/AMP-acid ligase II
MSARLSGAQTVFEAFAQTAAHSAARPFLEIIPETAARYGIAARTLSYEDALFEVDAAREAYRRAGIGDDVRVALLLGNRPDCFIHWLALNALGASVVPLNPDWRATELEYVLAHSEARLIVTLPQHRTAVAEAARRTPLAPVVTAPEEIASLSPGSFARQTRRQAPDARSECAVLYTSGTTGEPKGCLLPNEYFLWAGAWYAQLGGLATIRPGAERLVTPLPMYHMNAMAFSTMAMLVTGGCIVPLDRFHPQHFWSAVRAARGTILHYLGVMPALLLKATPTQEDARHELRFGFGAGVSAAQHALFETRFGFPLLEAWAMTETGAGAAIIAQREPRKPGTACFGRPEPNVEVRIIDAEERDVADDVPGELLVRSAGPEPRFGFFAGYLKNSAATAEAWRGGYFHTGDVVSRDADGLMHFIDRQKNVIRRSGENISAVEVETVALQHAAVAAVGVAAVADSVRGDEVLACIVRRDGWQQADPAALARSIVEFCLERLAYYKAPGYVAFCERLPLTATEKIQRSQLRAMARALHASVDCIDTRDMKRRGA